MQKCNRFARRATGSRDLARAQFPHPDMDRERITSAVRPAGGLFTSTRAEPRRRFDIDRASLFT
jgi:hypothetical protein